VANDRTPNQLYRNDDGVFADVALWAGVAFDEAGHESGAMGVDFGDYDGDGLLDLFVTNFDFEYNALYRNAGDGSFLDVTAEAGLAQPGYRFVGWGTGFFDYDNDGHLDIFVANGHVHEDMDVLSENVTFAQPNQLFHNETDGTFTEVSATSGPHFIEPRVSRGVAFADYDNDGDTDLVVLNTGGPVNLLRNDGGSRENWLALRLVGSSANRDAIGARVQVRTGSLNIVREVHAGSSYLSQNELELMFGLGGHSRVEHIHIRWPSGRTATIEDTPINRLMIIAEGREDEGSAGAIGVAD
ncbi:MAG: CRTAC1 family protein, partial [Candidatus Latescibacteria bacterium]|nr:CRTAC1 family protein [Candidatus Latescibacterota bacterium]